MKRIGIAAFTARGRELADRIADGLRQPPAYEIRMYESGLKDWCRAQFESHSDGIIFVGAAGIAVRSIAPFLKSKTTDPAVLVIDEAGQYVISLLSGHIGGANRLALMVAEMIKAVPVITTATDVNGRFAVDVFAKDNRLKIGSMKAAKEISAAILRGDSVGLYCEGRIEGTVPRELCVIRAEKENGGCRPELSGISHLICICAGIPDFLLQERLAESRMGVVRDGHVQEAPVILHLMPEDCILGIGCRRGKSEEEIEAEVLRALSQAGISMDQIFAAATIDLKKDEPGLLAFCGKYGLELTTYTAEELLKTEGDFSASEFVRKTTGVDNVCERAALRMAGAGGRLIQKKYAENGVTAAVAVRDWSVHFEK